MSTGNTIELQNNSFDNLMINSNGNFVFTIPIQDLNTYYVSIFQQPKIQQFCIVENGEGIIMGKDYNSVNVICKDDLIFNNSFDL